MTDLDKRVQAYLKKADALRADVDTGIRPEDYGLPPYPKGEVVGPCVCGSWPGGKCLLCRVVKRKS